MNRIINILLFILTIFIAANAEAVTLKWNIPTGDRLEVVRTANVKYLINSRTKRIYKERNIIDLTCSKKIKEISFVNGAFSVFHREHQDKVFHLREQYIADFKILSNGRFLVRKKDYMPNLRHLPTFPDKNINLNRTWKANGELILNNFSKRFKLICSSST